MDTSPQYSDPLDFHFADDGETPNNPQFPARIYRPKQAPGDPQLAAWFETRFEQNGWGNHWRNGVYPFLHYHSNTYEVLAAYSGSAIIQIGGDKGNTIDMDTGTVVILPAGLGHKRIHSTANFAVVGAYPNGFEPNLLCPPEADIDSARETISALPAPAKDPLTGLAWKTSFRPQIKTS